MRAERDSSKKLACDTPRSFALPGHTAMDLLYCEGFETSRPPSAGVAIGRLPSLRASTARGQESGSVERSRKRIRRIQTKPAAR